MTAPGDALHGSIPEDRDPAADTARTPEGVPHGGAGHGAGSSRGPGEPEDDRPGPRGLAWRQRLGTARLLLVFTPDLCARPLDALEDCAPHVDLVQVRPKPLGDPRAVSDARAVLDWTCRVLERLEPLGDDAPLVMVNDRVDVARALAGEGCVGVHLGQDDCPPRLAREWLGPDALLGLSTHDAHQLGAALDEPVDYLGFGPVHATDTKGYARGLGTDRAWIASEASTVPVFPIGGIDLAVAEELGNVGRAAVGSDILAAPDPGAAARALREALCGGRA